MKKHNMFGILVTTVSIATFAFADWPASGQDAKEIAELDATKEHLMVERGKVWVRHQGEAWKNSLPATVGNAVKKLCELYPDATFAVDPQVADVPVADLIVRSTNPEVDLEALSAACSGKFRLDSGPKSFYALEANSSTFKNDRNIECFNLTAYLSPMMARDHAEQEKVKPLAAMFGGNTHTLEAVNRLQEIIQRTIADFDPTIAQPHFQFYADAQLLILIGPQRAIEVAAKVIQALPGQQALSGIGALIARPDTNSNPAKNP
jgi:hypothetical protein